MSDSGVDHGRRRFLTIASAVTGGVGAAIAATPFVMSFRPSARAKAVGAPVRADISKIPPGGIMRVEWRGQPVFIVRRDEAALESIERSEAFLRDPASGESEQPEFATNSFRSIRPEVLVVNGKCTHLGCAPLYVPEVGAAEIGPDWLGGFFCPCHGSKFDLAGRVYAGVPAQLNLVVPPYRFLSDEELLIGDAEGAA